MSIPQSCKTDAQELTWSNARKKEIGANGKPLTLALILKVLKKC